MWGNCVVTNVVAHFRKHAVELLQTCFMFIKMSFQSKNNGGSPEGATYVSIGPIQKFILNLH